MITTVCSCGQNITYTATRPGEQPKDVRHVDIPGQPADCPQ